MCGELAEVQTFQSWDLGLPGFTFGRRFSWPGCSSEKSDLAPGIPTCPSSPHLTPSPGDSLLDPVLAEPLETPAKIFPEGSRQLEGPFGSIPASAQRQFLGTVGQGVSVMWLLGWGGCAPCAEGSAWHWAAPGMLMSLQPPHGCCSFSLSSPRPCSVGRRMGSRKNNPF